MSDQYDPLPFEHWVKYIKNTIKIAYNINAHKLDISAASWY